MSRREHLDERDVGISSAAASALGTVLDEEPRVFTVHFVLSKSTRSACGIDGISPNTNVGTERSYLVSCEACKAHLADRFERTDLRALARLRAARATGLSVHFGIARDTRERLIEARLAEVRGPNLHITVAGCDRLNRPRKVQP